MGLVFVGWIGIGFFSFVSVMDSDLGGCVGGVIRMLIFVLD